jgi:hypothetical protein
LERANKEMGEKVSEEKIREVQQEMSEKFKSL